MMIHVQWWIQLHVQSSYDHRLLSTSLSWRLLVLKQEQTSRTHSSLCKATLYSLVYDVTQTILHQTKGPVSPVSSLPTQLQADTYKTERKLKHTCYFLPANFPAFNIFSSGDFMSWLWSLC